MPVASLFANDPTALGSAPPDQLPAALAALISGGARVAAFRRKFLALATSGKFARLKPFGPTSR